MFEKYGYGKWSTFRYTEENSFRHVRRRKFVSTSTSDNRKYNEVRNDQFL